MTAETNQKKCPSCKKQYLNICEDNKPFFHTFGQCFYCGLSFIPDVYQLDFTSLNQIRKDAGLPKISKEEYNSYKKRIKEIF